MDMSIINITGGSDTISSTVSMILYQLIKNPRVISRLRDEIAAHEAAGTLSKTSVSF
jgi:cytochrome P450